MDQQLVSELLAGDSDELADLRANSNTLEGFINLVQKLDALPDISKRFWEASRSLFQATSKNREIEALESLLSEFFGPPVKPANKSLPRKLSKESTVKYLGGIHKEQSLFLLHLKTGSFYGALWPWRRNKSKVEIHLGYCSDWMVDEDYRKLEALVKRSVSQNTLSQMDAQIGGQIRGISLPSFLQMSEMEQSTYTLRVSSGGKVGHLHLVNGKLLDAQTDQWTSRDAAYRIISWDDATIEITPIAAGINDNIKQPLMHVMMESLKIKDEISTSASMPTMAPPDFSREPRKGSGIKTGKPLVRLERIPPPPKPSHERSKLLTWVAVLSVALIVIGAGVLFGVQYFQGRHIASKYNELMSQLDNTKDDAKIVMLIEQYLDSQQDVEHQADLTAQLEAAKKKVAEKDFEEVTLQISSFPVDEHYEKKAIELYSVYLEKHPNSEQADRIAKSIKDIKMLVDQYYYEELRRAARLDLNKRLEVYRDYMKRFPDGKYHQDVQLLINEMGDEHLSYLQSLDKECEENRRYDPCIARYDAFIQTFQHSTLAGKAARLKTALIEKRDWENLKRQVSDSGTDYEAAAQHYQEYLKTHPNSNAKAEIEQELTRMQTNLSLQRKWLAVRRYALNPANNIFERIQYVDGYIRNNSSSPYTQEAQDLLDQLYNQRHASEQDRLRREKQQEEQARIQREKELAAQRSQRAARIQDQLTALLAGSERYHLNGDGTVTDAVTGTMWCLLDSFQELNGCIDYQSGLSYVRDLRYGGYTDWRLPTANELAALYKKAPYFPPSGAEWYWTSESYAKGFHTVVDVVTAKPETIFERESRPQDQCGSVRAIRP